VPGRGHAPTQNGRLRAERRILPSIHLMSGGLLESAILTSPEPIMEAELQSLEDRIKLLASLCQNLRAENIELRQSVLLLKADNKRLSDKVEGAKTRVDALIAQVPQEDDIEEDAE
jgi:cell division protein ZapB